MPNLGFSELILIFLVVLLLFGARRIPEIARGLGKGIREFKDATTDVKRELMVEDTHRLQPPAYGQPTARTDFQQPYAAPQPAYGQPGATASAGPSGDPNTGLPSTGTVNAPYPAGAANDSPPPQTPSQG